MHFCCRGVELSLPCNCLDYCNTSKTKFLPSGPYRSELTYLPPFFFFLLPPLVVYDTRQEKISNIYLVISLLNGRDLISEGRLQSVGAHQTSTVTVKPIFFPPHHRTRGKRAVKGRKKKSPTAIKNASTTDKDSKLLGNDSKMDIAGILEPVMHVDDVTRFSLLGEAAHLMHPLPPFSIFFHSAVFNPFLALVLSLNKGTNK
ncbi:hypothetical protein CEXT_315731 [Caerostris extrusa]|uniref:Uncharacterized protein n=1 Tax=Caerostris extrusa TaxID=172846 RepID=A0AAV4NKJ0_CAEEX|nr:hypothetical protein CEXT_315731 [Caerostris extrusa]